VASARVFGFICLENGKNIAKNYCQNGENIGKSDTKFRNVCT
jgi:hypothetical protein